jgi:hypothetical protein
MGGIGGRIHEQLDGQRHHQQAQRGEASAEAREQQHGQHVFGRCRGVGGDFRRKQRQRVLLPEQRDGRLRKPRPAEIPVPRNGIKHQALDLGLAGFPEHRGD